MRTGARFCTSCGKLNHENPVPATTVDTSSVSVFRVQGVLLQAGGKESPYTGINGDYQPQNEMRDRRAVYIKIGKPTTAMWWANVSGKECWCVGPREKVGGAGMRIYVVSNNHSPDQIGMCAWTTYSYNSQSWVQQTGIGVLPAGLPAESIAAATTGQEGAFCTGCGRK